MKLSYKLSKTQILKIWWFEVETVLRNKRQPVQYNREESFYFKKNAFLFFLLGDVSSNGPEHISVNWEKVFRLRNPSHRDR